MRSATRDNESVTRPVVPTARGAMLAGVLGLALLTSACGSVPPVDASSAAGTVSATAGARAGASASSSTSANSRDDAEKPAVVVPRPADSLMGKYVPVRRNGRASAQTMAARRAPFTKPVRYVDGTTLKVMSIKQGTVTGRGPGVFPGQPTTTFALRLTNGTKKAISLNQVVVTATYGTPKRVASPVYDASARDFVGAAVAGRSVNATYAFSIPTADLGSVVMLVDFDGVHVSATFAGSVK